MTIGVNEVPSWEKVETYRSKDDLQVANLPHLFGDKGEFRSVVTETEKVLVKENSSWSWQNVASVFPMSDTWTDKPVSRPRS